MRRARLLGVASASALAMAACLLRPTKSGAVLGASVVVVSLVWSREETDPSESPPQPAMPTAARTATTPAASNRAIPGT